MRENQGRNRELQEFCRPKVEKADLGFYRFQNQKKDVLGFSEFLSFFIIFWDSGIFLGS
jgi:hypothetical protein